MQPFPMLAAFCATLVGCLVAVDTYACQPPPQEQEVVARLPAPDAVDVPIDSPVILHLRGSAGWGRSDSFAYGFSVALVDADGVEVTRLDVPPSENFGADTRSTISLYDDDPLIPLSPYTVRVSDGDQAIEWSFTTGEETRESPEPTNLVVSGTAGWESEDVYDCCPLEFPGECPNCAVIGTDPIAAVSLSFEPLEHPLGEAAWYYDLQRRRDEGPWETEPAAHIESLGHSIRLLGESVNLREYCYRAVATSLVEDSLVVVSNELCIPPTEFPERPDGVRDGRLQCGDDHVEEEEEGEESDPFDHVEEEESDDEEALDEDDDGEDDSDGPAGWELSEGGPGADSGCCSTVSTVVVPTHILVLFLVLGATAAARRRRCIKPTAPGAWRGR